MTDQLAVQLCEKWVREGYTRVVVGPEHVYPINCCSNCETVGTCLLLSSKDAVDAVSMAMCIGMS